MLLKSIEAVFENGVLRPLQTLVLVEQEKVTIQVFREGESDEEDSAELFDDEYAALCADEVDDAVSIEEVRQLLSKIKGSMDEAIDEDRGEY